MKKKMIIFTLTVWVLSIAVSITSSALNTQTWRNSDIVNRSTMEITETRNEHKETETNNILSEVTKPKELSESNILVDEEIQNTISNNSNSSTEAMTQFGSIIPDQSYIGVWYTDEYKTDDILIYEITSNSVKFNTGAFRLFGFTATATETGGELRFGYDNSIYGGLKGRLEFEENCVTVIYDDLGNFDDYNSINNIYKFTIKDSNSDLIVKQHNEVKLGLSVQ